MRGWDLHREGPDQKGIVMTKSRKVWLGVCLAVALSLGACLNAPRMAADLYRMERAAITACKDNPVPGCYARGECVTRIKLTLTAIQDYADALAAGRTPSMSAVELTREFESTKTYCAARGVILSRMEGNK